MLDKRLETARIVIAVIGLLISIYLATYSSLNIPLYCSNSGVVNCERVLTSIYSTTFGIPNSYWGIAFFVAVIVLIYLKKPILLFLLSGVGVGFVVYFIYLEYTIGSICIYCTGVHIITAALFLISLVEMRDVH